LDLEKEKGSSRAQREEPFSTKGMTAVILWKKTAKNKPFSTI
jgi:hypothetical protein